MKDAYMFQWPSMRECNGYIVEYILITSLIMLSVIIRIMFSLICCHFILIIIVHVIVYSHIMSKNITLC